MKDRMLLKGNNWLLVLLMALQLCSVRPIFKYLPYAPFSFLAIIIVAGIFYYWLFHYAAGRIAFLQSPLLTIILCVMIVGLNIYLYPQADALKNVLRGSDADDSVIIAATNLFHGKYPYAQLTYMGHKMSPGPGILLLMSPFVVTGLYVLAIPFYIILFVLAMKLVFKNWLIPNLALLLLMSSAGFWEYMIIGSDLVVIGVLFALLCYLVLQNQQHLLRLALLSVITGIFLTSRITFCYLIPVLALAVFRQNRKAGLMVGLLATLACVGVHAFFYYWQPENYSPMHLLQKGQQSANMVVLLSGAIANLALLFFFVRKKTFTPASALLYCWLFIIVPHLFIGAGLAITDKLNWAVSEGPGYLVIQVFIFLCSFFLTGVYTHKKDAGPGQPVPLTVQPAFTI